VIELAKR